MTNDPTREVDKVARALWERFSESAKSYDRGAFFTFGDEAVKTKMVLHSVAHVLTPILLEVETLRRKVADLEKM